MKKGIILTFAVLMLVFAGAFPAHARDGHHGGHGGFVLRGGIWIGPPWWGGPWWWGPPYYAYPYPYYSYPQQDETQIYVQPPAQEEEQQQGEDYYWYYCTNPQGYYPYVKKCPNGWLKVVPSGPSSQGPEGEYAYENIQARRFFTSFGGPRALRVRYDPEGAERDGASRRWKDLRPVPDR